MRTIITLTDQQVRSLQQLCDEANASRAELIRMAVDEFIEKKRIKSTKVDVFGLWKKRKIDALKYEDKLREEW